MSQGIPCFAKAALRTRDVDRRRAAHAHSPNRASALPNSVCAAGPMTALGHFRKSGHPVATSASPL
jgi:hypothetical protein